MKTGEVYLFDNSAGYKHAIVLHEKIISCDKYEVFTDSKLIDEKSWSLDSPRKRTAIFTRSSTINFERWSTMIGHETYSEDRLRMLRPDLPMRIGRIRNMSWGDYRLDSKISIERYLEEQGNWLQTEFLKSSEIYLGGNSEHAVPQKPVLLNAENGSFFTLSEILFAANKIQTAIETNFRFKTQGIGIYRSGIRMGVPSYYIWGFYDLADNLKAYEDMGIDISGK